MRGHLEVEGGWPLADAAGRVVVRTVAGAVVPAEVSRVGNGHATQVGADPDHDEELGVLSALFVGLGVAEGLEGHRLFGRDFFGRSGIK